eukprot:146885-Amphidinium_carterae.1
MELPQVSVAQIDSFSFAVSCFTHLGANDGYRFCTQVHTVQRGHYLSHQVERFRLALCAFQKLTFCSRLVDTVTSRASLVDWGAHYGLPKLPRILIRLAPPPSTHVFAHEQIQVIAKSIAVLSTNANKGEELWRRVEIGVTDFQLSVHGSLSCLPLVTCGLNRRLSKKTTPPPWWHQVSKCRSFHKCLAGHPAYHTVVGGISVGKFLLDEGIASAYQLKSFRAILRLEIKRAAWLQILNKEGMQKQHHIVASTASDSRVTCVACHDSGPMKFTAVWVQKRCDRSVSFCFDSVCANLRSYSENSELRAVLAAGIPQCFHCLARASPSAGTFVPTCASPCGWLVQCPCFTLALASPCGWLVQLAGFTLLLLLAGGCVQFRRLTSALDENHCCVAQHEGAQKKKIGGKSA